MAVHESIMDVPSIAFGFLLGFSVLTASKIFRQSRAMYKRTRRIWNPYPWMCWLELIVDVVMAVITWMFLRGDIPGSFPFYFATVALWTVQTQLLMQIIANRLALVIPDRRRGTKIKWALGIAVGIVNISVFCIWIPARMEVSETFIHVNEIWDRIEKVIYLVIDLALNAYFLYLVRSRLITKGLTKYQSLFKFNAGIILVSLSMDVLIIAMMSLPNTYIYVQFHPVAYIVKLNIECSMADLISKIVSKKDRTDPLYSNSNSHPTELTSHTRTGKNPHVTSVIHSNYKAGATKGDPDEISLDSQERGHAGIMKTVATTVVMDERSENERRGSMSSSTVQLSEEYRMGPRSDV
ncbi:hypothetical protein CC78DRAFT_604253 [Lojkania enalia]|uniref:Uncharacterized protein n=1 Tax=Lojkania enalia TaxID=147567 RepID=A0A9P4NAI9_9PLEO|nr:hypothetical protein CC78DRAFT_604253 [Didymosphaeria enalia]